MEDQIFRTIDSSIKVVKDSWSKDITEIRCMLQEVVGKMSPTAPRFSLGPHSSMEAESVKIPRFSGDDPVAWVFQVEQYFTHYNIFSDHKLSLASLYLDGEALDWYCWLFRNKQLADWDHFVAKLLIRFQTQSRKAPDMCLALLRQLNTVNSCPTRAATTPSWSTLADAPLPHYWNLGYEHNNQTFAHKVFGEKPDRKTENIGDVETMLQTPDVMRPKGEYKDTPVQVKIEGAEILITRAKQENCHSNGIFDSDLDDNEEDPLPLVIAVADINVRGGEPLHTETGVEVIESKQQKLFGVHPQKIRQHFFDNEVVDSLLERSDPLILDGTRLMHKHIFIHFLFDPGESIPPSIMFESFDIHLDISHYLSEASSDHSSTHNDIVGIPLFDTDTYTLAYYVSMSSGKEGMNAKKEWKDHLSHIHELLLVNIIKVPHVDTSNASKLKTIIILFLMVFTCSSQANYNTPSCRMKFPDMNLEDKVLFGAGSIDVNLNDSIRAYGLNVVNKTDSVDIIGPRKYWRVLFGIQAQLAIVKKI